MSKISWTHCGGLRRSRWNYVRHFEKEEGDVLGNVSVTRTYIFCGWFSSRTTDARWSLFSLKPRSFGLGQTNWQINSGVFSAKLSAPILVQWVPCPCFPFFNQAFIYILNIYLGLGFEFEFGPQRIRYSAFVFL